MSGDHQVSGKNPAALFDLKVHRGDGMALIAMNWKSKKGPPDDFVGFAIEYREPNGDRFFALKNRLAFPLPDGAVNSRTLSTRLSPIQKFRWVHFPRNAELAGDFHYKVTPVFMNGANELSYGEPQEVAIELRRETYPGVLNVTFTRGFVSSQAFVDRFGRDAVPKLLPQKAEDGLDFVPSHPRAQEALTWMGFEARSAILELLDKAIADKKATVKAVLYDLNEPGIVSRLEQLGTRLKIIIDDDGKHGEPGSAESVAAKRLAITAGANNVRRQHMGKLQHNKTIVVNGPKVKAALCGSTNHSWRGFFVQNNNAIVMRGKAAVKLFGDAFDAYFDNPNKVADFGATASATWQKLGLRDISAQIGFSPRSKKNAVLKSIADDIRDNTASSLFFSLAFLFQTPGAVLNAIKKVKEDKKVFCYGISDHAVGALEDEQTDGIDIQKPDGSVTVVSSAALVDNVPEPFHSEPTGGGGTRMHHKFIVIDFDKPTARVYMGSYNFSQAADISNGENLLLIRNRRIAVSYVVEALRIFDHYHFRLAKQEAGGRLQLRLPPRQPGEKTWWRDYYEDPRKIKDREVFC